MLAAEGIDHRCRAQLRACNTTTMDMVSKQGSEQGSEEGDFQTRSATRCIGQAARRQEDWLAASQAARQTGPVWCVCRRRLTEAEQDRGALPTICQLPPSLATISEC